MALVPTPTWQVSVSFQDRDENPGSVQVQYSSATNQVDLTTHVEDTLIPAITAASNGTIIAWRASFGAFDAEPVEAAEASDVERKGVFQFIAANGAKTKMELPSINNTLVVDGTNVLDPTNPLVVAVINAMTVANAGGDRPTTYLGAELVKSFGTPHKIHRGSSKG